MKGQPESLAERLESATATLEKEAKFLDELIASPVSANIANRIAVMTQMYKTVAEDIPLYLSRHASTLFVYKPDRVALVLKILLDEIARYARLAAYLSVKGIFPQAVSVLRNVIELIGVYTHVWHEPEKVDWIGDSDSKSYSRAFRYTPDKQLKAQLKARGDIHYRFHHCRSAQILTEFYKLLSRLFVHSGSLESMGLPASKADELSCYFVDRVSPDDLQQQYRLIQTALTIVLMEIFYCIPETDLMDGNLAALTIIYATLFPISGDPNDKLEPEMEFLVDEAIRVVGDLLISDNTQ